jgi:hypothetical protein
MYGLYDTLNLMHNTPHISRWHLLMLGVHTSLHTKCTYGTLNGHTIQRWKITIALLFKIPY